MAKIDCYGSKFLIQESKLQKAPIMILPINLLIIKDLNGRLELNQEIPQTQKPNINIILEKMLM